MSRAVAIVLAYAPDVCGIEFPAPWHVVSLRREDIVLSEDEGNDAIQKVRANGDRCRRRDGYRLQNGSDLVAVNCLLRLIVSAAAAAVPFRFVLLAIASPQMRIAMIRRVGRHDRLRLALPLNGDGSALGAQVGRRDRCDCLA